MSKWKEGTRALDDKEAFEQTKPGGIPCLPGQSLPASRPNRFGVAFRDAPLSHPEP